MNGWAIGFVLKHVFGIYLWAENDIVRSKIDCTRLSQLLKSKVESFEKESKRHKKSAKSSAKAVSGY